MKVSPGRITLEEDVGTFDVPAFFISKYPVTYRQYRAFLEAEDGYQNDQWWTGLVHEPEPGEQYRKIDNHPADTVSWFDAMAYCRWLGDKLGYEIRLPTEWEWQQAATGGQKKNDYPWGTQFDSDRCNTYGSGLGRTNAVGLYPDGKSPVGALDMSGNVWEWCVNCFNNPKAIDVHSKGDSRVVRGGSWYNRQNLARAAYRDGSHPDGRDHDVGFRLVCSSPILETAGH
jgi:formylglycine-generating enzyme required for sulfatase activity